MQCGVLYGGCAGASDNGNCWIRAVWGEKKDGLCYFSEYHFMRFFKKHMNMTCMEFLNNLRLEKAVELLKDGNASILEVSLSVGFHNLSYFHRAFKKKYRMTPGEFLKNTDN